MVGDSPVSPPPDVTAAPCGGPSKFLADLPSRGFFSSTVVLSNPGGMRVYICDHDTSPSGPNIVLNGSSSLAEELRSFIAASLIIQNVLLVKIRVSLLGSLSDSQLITTNQTNILIRSLMIKNQKGDSSSKIGKGTASSQGSRKRAAEKVLDEAAGKKAMSSTQLGGLSRLFDKDLQSYTVERLRAFLKERGLTVKGKKDELIARLRGVNS